MTGTVVVEAAVEDLEAARAALARAIASGALGPGRTVRRDGDGCAFDDGRVDLGSDGRVRWRVSLASHERLRLAEAVVLATLASVVATLGFSFIFYTALAAGALVGGVYAAARIGGDRAVVRARVRALVASLPVLVDTRRE
jgi:hypothetical protein